MKEKQYCNKFNKDLKIGPHKKKKFKNKKIHSKCQNMRYMRNGFDITFSTLKRHGRYKKQSPLEKTPG